MSVLWRKRSVARVRVKKPMLPHRASRVGFSWNNGNKPNNVLTKKGGEKWEKSFIPLAVASFVRRVPRGGQLSRDSLERSGMGYTVGSKAFIRSNQGRNTQPPLTIWSAPSRPE